MSFLQTCTQPVAPLDHAFWLNEVPQLEPIPRLEREVKDRFGPDFGVPHERVGDALDFLDEIDPQPTNQWGMAPIWFATRATFRILDPATACPLPGQEPKHFRGAEYAWQVPLGSSGLRLFLHNRATLAIELCLPNADNEVLHRVVPWLQGQLPCRFSPKHWRAWTPTTTGSFRSRKMPDPVPVDLPAHQTGA